MPKIKKTEFGYSSHRPIKCTSHTKGNNCGAGILITFSDISSSNQLQCFLVMYTLQIIHMTWYDVKNDLHPVRVNSHAVPTFEISKQENISWWTIYSGLHFLAMGLNPLMPSTTNT